jgi:hypothetical protein
MVNENNIKISVPIVVGDDIRIKFTGAPALFGAGQGSHRA